MMTRALWTVAPGRFEIRTGTLATDTTGMIEVRALQSAVSRGTERLHPGGDAVRRRARERHTDARRECST